MTPFTTHDGITIDRPGIEVWLAGMNDKPTPYATIQVWDHLSLSTGKDRYSCTFKALCYRGRVFATRAGAVAYRREILLARRAEIDAELAQLESEAGQ